MRIGDERQQLVEVLLDQRANLPVRQTLRGWIHRKHQPWIALTFVARLRKHDELARHNLFAVVVAHRPRHQQELPFLDLPLEERTPWPGTLEQSARVSQHRAEHAQAAARRQHTGVHDAPDARHVLADGGARQRCDGRGIEIPMGNMVEQVTGSANAESLEGLSAFRPDALEEFDGRIELQLHPLTRWCANRTGSKTSRSSSVSPVPRKRMGTGSARRSPTTLPPLAVPSSFVTTRPVNVTAAASSTLRPSLCNRFASFATEVVLPVPFTPKISITVGGWAARASGVPGGPSCSTMMRSSAA